MPLHAQQAACNALIRRSIDLGQLYRHAAAASEPGMRLVLNDNAQTLDLLIADLQAQLRAAGGKPHGGGSWRGAVQCRLAAWLLRLAARPEGAWLRLLAHRESALLHRFERAIAALPTETARGLMRQLPRLHGIHMDMHSLAGPAR
ncbi:MAG: hypothetical protein KGJ96_09180 [Xanthomonadaceae bacterium]|nr:hypothetical protein [Xanthomonadaceae bacterium]MDE2248729.1 hypothetical protein [Xanthomonadaceae bacterium]